MDEAARRDELGGDLPVDRDVPVAYGSSTPGKKGRWVLPALIAALVVCLASAVVFGTLYLTSDVSSGEVGQVLSSQIPEVEAAATKVANLLMNYDSTNLDEVALEMLTLATGNFREQYEEVLSSGTGLGPALEEAGASSRGRIIDGPNIYFKTGTEAIALIRTTQFAQSNSNASGTTILYELKITLIDTQDGGWKADRVEVLGTQEQA